jgi:hypothetical protein
MYNNFNNNGYGPGRGGGFGGGLGNPLSYVVKGVATGIGLASESIHARKEKKAAKNAAESEVGHPSQSKSPAQEPPEQADNLSQPQGSRKQSDYGAPQISELPGEQSYYSASPAREANRNYLVSPENSKRGGDGTVPELEEGDEEQWDLDDAQDELIKREPVDPKKRPFERGPQKLVQHFIDDYPLTQASPWLNAINVAGFALMPLHLAPVVGQAATVALAITVSIIKNMQSRKRHAYTISLFKNSTNLGLTADCTPSSTKLTNNSTSPEVSTAWY